MREIAIAIFPGVQALDVAGPHDVFAEANSYIQPSEHYKVVLLASSTSPIRASNGMQLLADDVFDQSTRKFDTVLVAGGPALPESAPEKSLIYWLISSAPLANRYGSICTGAFALGHAGLLAKKKVTTHWQNAHDLAKQFPEAIVDFDCIYIWDGNLLTSAGVTAGIDVALSIVAEDHGSSIALQVAKRLVVVAHRRGGQSQFSPLLIPTVDQASPIAKALKAMTEDIGHPHSVGSLAEIAGMSPRNFARLFVQTVEIPPFEFLERVRLDASRGLLESSELPLKTIAFECGFGTADRMRLAYQRKIGVTPTEYRMSFRRKC